ncbi:uncharacterized protein B0H18DRAFT_56864 [Fomitopsis serialis]|uniref:uncharacterized protein n=1 Tax=Fomitopsis serialis TaxID=139415 RepID=UPI0020082BED|nr:uncharacterized protein B0H18DRAFT_56864 [Neoantrodia serialis]KAH9916880.1 hypothetical protein B0H18DRAFT_56864 [Neoantrodia serialis]
MDRVGHGYPSVRADVLNEDVWFTVLSFIDPTDAPNLSLVSRTIHRLLAVSSSLVPTSPRKASFPRPAPSC